MTEDNSRQPGEPSISSSPQSHGMYPPPQSYSPTRSAFVDIRIGDYTRDGTAAALLFVSLFLPWRCDRRNSPRRFECSCAASGSAGHCCRWRRCYCRTWRDSECSGRIGMSGRYVCCVWWPTDPSLPLLWVLVVYDVIRGMFRFSESSSVFTGNGVGAGAWFGLAGALLAAQPRAAEIRIDPRTAPRWLALVKPLVFVAWGVVSGLGATRADLHPGLRQSLPILRRAADIREPDRSLRVVGRSDRRGGCCGSRSRQTVCVLAPHHRRARHRSPRGRITPLDQRGHKCRAVPHGHG